MADDNGVSYYELGLTARVNPDGTIDEEYSEDVREIFQSWLGTHWGRQFIAEFNSKANLDRITKAIAALGEFISVRTVDQAYADLRDAGSLEPTPPSAAELGQQRRRAMEAEFQQFYSAASAAQIKERSNTDKRFSGWLKGRLADETAQPEQLPPHPDFVALQEEQKKLQRMRDKKYNSVPPEIRQWVSEVYHRLTADQLKQRLGDPRFREQVNRASEFGLL